MLCVRIENLATSQVNLGGKIQILLTDFSKQQFLVNYALSAKIFECKHSILGEKLARGESSKLRNGCGLNGRMFGLALGGQATPQNFPAQSKMSV